MHEILTNTGAGVAPWAVAPMKFSEDSNFDGAQQNLDCNFCDTTMLKLPTSKILSILNKTMMPVLLTTKTPILFLQKSVSGVVKLFFKLLILNKVKSPMRKLKITQCKRSVKTGHCNLIHAAKYVKIVTPDATQSYTYTSKLMPNSLWNNQYSWKTCSFYF